MTMGEYIKYLRIEKGLSQAQLGKEVGVERAAVQKWEKGSVENIKRSTILKLSKVFNVSPCDLMKWDEEIADTSQQQQKEMQLCELFEQCYGTDAFEAVTMFLKLDERDRGYIVGKMETILEHEKYSVKERLKNA